MGDKDKEEVHNFDENGGREDDRCFGE